MISPAFMAKYTSASQAALDMARTEGIRGFYNGVGPLMYRNGLWNGIYFGFQGIANEHFHVQDMCETKTQRLICKFVLGVIGSSLGTLANTPFDVVKSRMQQQPGGPNPKYKSTIQSLRLIYAEEGL